MTTTRLRADPSQARQLALEGAMLLWRDQVDGGRREGLLLRTDVCANPACTDRHIGVEALRVESDLVAVQVHSREISTAYPPGSTAGTRKAFFVSVDPDDGHVEPQGDVADADALATSATPTTSVLSASGNSGTSGMGNSRSMPSPTPRPRRSDPPGTGGGEELPTTEATTPPNAPSRSSISMRGARSNGKASRNCRETQSAVGWSMTAQRTASRREVAQVGPDRSDEEAGRGSRTTDDSLGDGEAQAAPAHRGFAVRPLASRRPSSG